MDDLQPQPSPPVGWCQQGEEEAAASRGPDAVVSVAPPVIASSDGAGVDASGSAGASKDDADPEATQGGLRGRPVTKKKRTRLPSAGGVGGSSSIKRNSRGAVPVLSDDTEFQFTSDSVKAAARKAAKRERGTAAAPSQRETRTKKESESLPSLLYARQLGCTSRNRKSSIRWQRRVLTAKTTTQSTFSHDATAAATSGRSTYSFRPYAAREISFTSLQTPGEDAVLGLERTGAYLLCLGGDGRGSGSFDDFSGSGDETNEDFVPNLTVRLYGVPGPSVYWGQRKGTILSAATPVPRSPLLTTVPLVFGLDRLLSSEGSSGYVVGDMADSLWCSYPATVPVQFWISSDWRVGVALVRVSCFSTPSSASSGDQHPARRINGQSVCSSGFCRFSHMQRLSQLYTSTS